MATDFSVTWQFFSKNNCFFLLRIKLQALTFKNILYKNFFFFPQTVPQLQLALTRPGLEHKDILAALQTRFSDSGTREFLRRERRKLIS
jgi:hypothetical protein